jgi:hypothetical protein
MIRSLLALALLLAACPAPPVDDDDSASDDDDSASDDDDATPPFDPSGYELLTYDLTERAGRMDTGNAEHAFHAQRFWIDTPLRVVAVEALFWVPVDADSTANLSIWPDEGNNFFDFLRETPYREWELELNNAEHHDVWQTVVLDEPLVIPHPQPLWVGSQSRGDSIQPLLGVDASVDQDPFLVEHSSPEERWPPHLVVYPDRGTNEGGGEYFYFAGQPGEIQFEGDLMVRLYVERFDVVKQTWFTDRTASDTEPMDGLFGSGSPGFADCDGDGWMDVWDGRLRRNNGDGTFTDVHDASGIDAGGAPAWGDFDNDGNIDLFLAGGADQLFRGLGGCTFENVTAASGIDDTQLFDTSNDNTANAELQPAPTPSAAWVDVDNDGWLDLQQANFLDFGTGDGTLDYLWHNQGDGTFVNITADAGMLTPQGGGLAGRTVGPADWDNDGDMDIYVGNYRLHKNYAWENRTTDDGISFANIGTDSWLEGDRYPISLFSGYYGHTIGVDWGDVDNDGDLDLFAANLAHPRFIEFSDKSMFLRNQLMETGTASFDNVRDSAGMIYMETDSSPMFLDYDNDGYLDLFYTAVYQSRPSYLFHNNGDFTFTMVSYPAGTWIYNGWGVSYADVDNDGDLDIYGGRYLRNDSAATGGSIAVEVVGSGAGFTNRSGIGARVEALIGDQVLLREVTSAVGVSSGKPLLQTIGIGEASEAQVVVTFPASGEVVDAGLVPAGARIRVHEDGTVD